MEDILIAKGNKVLGPFSSYEEMTFPERDRCTYLIQPTFLIDLDITKTSNFVVQLEWRAPDMKLYPYGTLEKEVSGSIKMEYVILDPLTHEKLERHKLEIFLLNN